MPTRANVPDDLPPDELTLDRAKELLASPSGVEKELGAHPETGLMIVAKSGRFGPYVTEALPEDAKKADKPRTASLFKDMDLDTITLDQAVQLLKLPRVVYVEEDGTEVTAQNGRYGPYLKKGTDSRSLEREDQLLTITEEEVRAIYAQPKTYGRRAAAAPLKELGNDPVSGSPVVAKDGRFGMYVTDGEYNATLRKDDSLETLTPERAFELLAERRAKGPAKKGGKKVAGRRTGRRVENEEDQPGEHLAGADGIERDVGAGLGHEEHARGGADDEAGLGDDRVGGEGRTPLALLDHDAQRQPHDREDGDEEQPHQQRDRDQPGVRRQRGRGDRGRPTATIDGQDRAAHAEPVDQPAAPRRADRRAEGRGGGDRRRPGRRSRRGRRRRRG